MTSKNILSKSIIPDVKNINNLIYAIIVTLVPAASMLAWVIIPFVYLQGKAPINDDVTKFLTVFSKNYHPLIVSAVAVIFIGISVVLMIKKQVIHNFIEEIKQK